MILRTKTSDQRFTMATITGAKVSGDLKIAHVFVSVLGDASQVDEVMSSLKDAQGFFRREIGRSVNLKYTPEIRFVYDESMSRGQRILDELSLINDDDDDERIGIDDDDDDGSGGNPEA